MDYGGYLLTRGGECLLFGLSRWGYRLTCVDDERLAWAYYA